MIKKILVSQPKPTSEKSPYFEIASKYGVEVVFRPFIKIEGLSAKEFRQQKVSILDYTAVVFTSRNAIDHFFLLCKELRVTIPEDMKYFCITETIALYIQKICAVPQTQGLLRLYGQKWTICSRLWSSIKQKNIWFRCRMYTTTKSRTCWIPRSLSTRKW